ncbi:hypothetical protein I4U23_011460 [Adineta vaga]|nr:hypothetical protein I4U23_011460 [Adineta vaga]
MDRTMRFFENRQKLIIGGIFLSLFVQLNGQRLEIKRTTNSDLSSSSLYVPLKKVDIDATINSFAADVTITQIFYNNENKPFEAVYYFPIEEQAAIYSFIARINDREIFAELKEKNVAQKEYIDALKNNHGAYLLEQDEKSPDMFIINIGALPPLTECTITISYVTELDLINGSIIRFVIPTTIAPRYNSQQTGSSSFTSPNIQYVQNSPYTINFRCNIKKISDSKGELIRKVSSSSHQIEIDVHRSDIYVVTFAHENTHLDRDILINIELMKRQTNTILTVDSNAVMVSFFPTEEDCRQGENDNQTNEFIFVVDCSGSMYSEDKIGLTKKAVILFLQNLPPYSYFNIIRFGSTYSPLFPESTVIANDVNLQQAQKIVEQMQADLGGTELFAPLQWLKNHPPNKGRSRQIFLLTDGQIMDVSQVLDLCRTMSSSTRIFSFGLGMSPSRALIKGLARATNGRFVFIPPHERVDIYVKEQLDRALQPSITGIRAKWNLGETSVYTAPAQLPPVYAKDRLNIYGLTNTTITLPLDDNFSVGFYIDENDHQLGEAHFDQILIVENTGTISRLAAKALIHELEHAKELSTGSLQSRFQDQTDLKEKIMKNEEMKKKQITELSLKYNILSPYTAFIAVEKRVNGNNDNMILREVPIQISADDQHLISPMRSTFTSTTIVTSDTHYITTTTAFFEYNNQYVTTTTTTTTIESYDTSLTAETTVTTSSSEYLELYEHNSLHGGEALEMDTCDKNPSSCSFSHSLNNGGHPSTFSSWFALFVPLIFFMTVYSNLPSK